MPHNFEIDRKAGVLTETFSGLLSLEQLTDANASIIAHPDFVKGLHFLTDLLRAEIRFGYREMCAHVQRLPRLHISKQAFVVMRPVDYGMVRMFITLAEDKDIYDEAQLFSSTEEAKIWLTS